MKFNMPGPLEYFQGKLFPNHHDHNRQKQEQTVELKVRMDCDGCETKVRKALESMSGVSSVEVNRKMQKVTVNGYLDPGKVLKRAKRTGKRVEIWPYAPCNAVTAPMVTAQNYDKKAPAGYVRNVEYNTIPSMNSNRPDSQYTSMFSEENANACTIM
uniref:TSA: Wollemia nobilis Ref_Wollemi_Transcript_14378_1013 transcribed RNA sequence n=1 Tax=Wollemia nobilis TaxID=56998 RepID=A0A0C9RSX7_9CONI